MNTENLVVDQYTTPNPKSVQLKTPLPQVWQIMKESGIRHLLVLDESKKIEGVLSHRDVIMFSQASNFEKITAKEIMSTDLLIVSPQEKLSNVAFKMSKEKFGSAIVQDPLSNYVGIFTATDALNALVEVLRGEH